MRAALLALSVVAWTWMAPMRAEAKPAARPAAVLGKFTLGAPSGLDGVKAFVNGIQPGYGSMLSADTLLSAIMGLPTSGLDTSGPLHVIFVSDKASGQHGMVLMAKVADKTQLGPDAQVKGDWAVIGAAPLVKVAAPWALGSLTGSVPADLVGTFYPDSALALYGSEIAAVKAKAIGQSSGITASLVATWMDGLEGFAKDTIAVTFRVDANKDRLGFDMSFAPKAKSRLAQFVKSQKPLTLDLLGKLAPGPAPMLMVGTLSLGPYRDAMIQMMGAMYGQMSSPDMVPAFTALMAATTGEFAGSFNMDKKLGMQLRAIYGITDPKAAETGTAKLFAMIAKPQTTSVGNVTTTTVAVPGTTTYDGVTIRAYDSTTTPATIGTGKMRGQVGVVDKYIAVTSDGAINTQIDTLRGKGSAYAPTTSQQGQLALAVARKDSFTMTFDMGAFAGLGGAAVKLPVGTDMMFSMGFADRSAHLYFGMPAATLKALMSSAGAAAGAHP